MVIKVLEKTKDCMPVDLPNGDWFDLRLAEDITLRGPFSKSLRRRTKDGQIVERFRDVVFSSTLARLGVSMELPKDFEAILLPRSSTFLKYGLLQGNSAGVIDYTYKGDDDEWKMIIVATRAITIPKGTRIAQFRIQPTQKASMWAKLKWLFSSKIEFEKVKSLDNPDRGGFGHTGD